MKYNTIADDVRLGKNVRLSNFINLYGCSIGDNTKIGPFVEVQKNAFIGSNCKIQSHTFICEGVTIEDNVFIGHGVTFVNDKYPRATAGNGRLQDEQDWQVMPILVRQGASVGSGVTILCNVTIGENAIIGSGSVVTKDVPPDTIVAGAPARVMRRIGREQSPPEERVLLAVDAGSVPSLPLPAGLDQEQAAPPL
jgi:acetyltransferase-like isoleucine patch superfamily enzyme